MLILIYLLAVVLANLSVATFGPGSVLINAFVFVALDFVARDALHKKWAGPYLPFNMFFLIAAGGFLSFLVNSSAGQIALASTVAFTLSAALDTFVFSKLKNFHWYVRSNGSNLAGAALDSLLFTTLAFGALMPLVILGQVVAKFGGGLLWSVLLKPKGERLLNYN